jgi:hypothetical protein
MIHSFPLYGTSVPLWDSDYEPSHQLAQAKDWLYDRKHVFS